jgi:DNA-binding FadR family transcriptional regulator
MPGSAPDRACNGRARRDIVTGVIAVDEPIDETALGARYGLGRTPIREALKQLRNDQLIVWPDRRSPYLPEIGVAHVTSLHEARSTLETQIAVLAAQRITDTAADRLDELVAEEADLVEGNMGTKRRRSTCCSAKGSPKPPATPSWSTPRPGSTPPRCGSGTGSASRWR